LIKEIPIESSIEPKPSDKYQQSKF